MPPPSRSGRWRRHDHAHHRMLHTALAEHGAGDRNRQQPNRSSSGTIAANQTRPHIPRTRQKRRVDRPPLFRHAGMRYSTECSLWHIAGDRGGSRRMVLRLSTPKSAELLSGLWPCGGLATPDELTDDVFYCGPVVAQHHQVMARGSRSPASSRASHHLGEQTVIGNWNQLLARHSVPRYD